jgi:hypothetical protein
MEDQAEAHSTQTAPAFRTNRDFGFWGVRIMVVSLQDQLSLPLGKVAA